jgi:hypothetical protein
MSRSRLRLLACGFLVAGAASLYAKPAFACHEATGWCCVPTGGGHVYCCYFEDNQLQPETCGSL